MLFTLSIMALLIVIHTMVSRASRHLGKVADGKMYNDSTPREINKRAWKIQRAGVVLVLVVLVAFNAWFWSTAIKEYTREAEGYFNIDV